MKAKKYSFIKIIFYFISCYIVFNFRQKNVNNINSGMLCYNIRQKITKSIKVVF